MKYILVASILILSNFAANSATTTTQFHVRLTVLETCTTVNGKVSCAGGLATNTQRGYDAISQETNGNLVTITY